MGATSSAGVVLNMEIVRFSGRDLPEGKENLTMALGFFDGMHLGHQDLLSRAALEASGLSSVLLFTALPFKGDDRCLTSLEDKLRIAAKLRIDVAYVYEPDEAFFAMGKEEFIRDFLLPLGVKRVVVGEDYRFGKGASGNVEDLKGAFALTVVPTRVLDGERVSSSRIKQALCRREVALANRLLGRPYQVVGKIVHGKARGRTIGFPTLNFALSAPYLLPPDGIYAGIAYVLGLPYLALINVGMNPTFGELLSPLVEAHLLGYEGDAYGKTVYLDFLDAGREEKKFAGIGEP